MRTVFYYSINAGFLIYGLLRLLGALPGFAHIMGWWDNPIGSEIVAALEPSFPDMSSQAIIPISMAAYMGWSALMGVVLTLGSLLALFRIRAGYGLMGCYFALFGAMFVNYLSLNQKLIDLGVGLAFFALMVFLAKPSKDADASA